jgi:8-oxo-dGTP pyrophosphatase MutT (NUDIX family)
MEKGINTRKRYISCTNCGTPGHVLKKCNQPITSFGIIVYKERHEFDDTDLNPRLRSLVNIQDNGTLLDNTKILLIQRKDTIGFTDFLRGKYETEQTLALLFSEMTMYEQRNLLTESFDDLWDKLWINHNSKTYKNEYVNAKYKLSCIDLPSYIKKYPSQYTFSEFSIPKGRKNVRESNMKCAEREFYEETGYNSDDYACLDPDNYIIEEFTGTDNIKYKHVYYITKVLESKIRNPQIQNQLQMEEVMDIGWFSINEALHVMRPYDTAKKQVILSFMSKIQSDST